jgi:hypothetical protein
MTRPGVGDSVRVKDGYVDESGRDVRPGYGGEVVDVHDGVAEIEFVGLQSGAEFTGATPIAVEVDWLDVVE